MEYITKDGGKRTEFPTGMVRDTKEGKTRYDLCSFPMLKRWAELMMRGAEKYGENNWMLARTGEELSRFDQAALRHLYQLINGEDPEEDHAAAVFFNIACREYVKERLNKKK